MASLKSLQMSNFLSALVCYLLRTVHEKICSHKSDCRKAEWSLKRIQTDDMASLKSLQMSNFLSALVCYLPYLSIPKWSF